MHRELKYYQIAHPSLLIQTDKMNDVDNESESERENIYFLMKSIVYFRVGGAHPAHPLDKSLVR
jgi:hypothetical protein